MTSKTSLFSSGIFKNNIHRFKWGSILYFIILFFASVFPFLVNNTYYDYNRGEILTSPSFMIVPTLLCTVVPIIVAILVFSPVHSQKPGIFVHSLPIKRITHYITNLLSSFFLMIVPCLAISAVLIVMNLTGYKDILTLKSIIVWFIYNFAILFIMFSFAAFSAFLTGNTVSNAVIYGILHFLPIVLAFLIYFIGSEFMFGFTESTNSFSELIINKTPIIWVFSSVSLLNSFSAIKFFSGTEFLIYLSLSIVMYILSFILYKKRKTESCSDVAGFKSFKPILKYTVTSITAIFSFYIISFSGISAVWVFIFGFVISAVFYFASEMVMRKSFKVFDSFKGFAVFVLVILLMSSLFAYTDIFGYETRIPNESEVNSAGIYCGFDKITSKEKGAVNDVINIHKEKIKNIPITNKYENSNTIKITYYLKDGSKLDRQYSTNDREIKEVLTKMYQYYDYKLKSVNLYNVNPSNYKFAQGYTIFENSEQYSFEINEDVDTVVNLIIKDIENIGYDEIENVNGKKWYHIDIFKIDKDDKDVYNSNKDTIMINLTEDYKNTFEFLKEKGYIKE